jgi:hypothetical protein
LQGGRVDGSIKGAQEKLRPFVFVLCFFSADASDTTNKTMPA